MLMPGRTGSSYVIEKLSHHPMIHAAGEILDEHRLEPDSELRLSKQLALTEDFFSRRYPADIKWVGFKTKLYPGEWSSDALDQLHKTLIDLQIQQVVLMLRSNIVKQALSFCRAENLHKVSNVWNISSDTQALGVGEVNPIEFQSQLANVKAQNEAVVSFLQRFDCPAKTFYYEDLLKDESRFFQEIHELFGVPPIQTHSVTQKHTSDDLRKSVSNFGELRQTCNDPSLREMFDEVIRERPDQQPVGGKRILVAVMTQQGNEQRRDAILSSWLQGLPKETQFLFFAGGAIETERTNENLVLSCTDRNEAEKMHAFLTYAIQNLQFDYIFKCNDDCYVDVHRLLDCGFRKYDYYGNLPAGFRSFEEIFADTSAYFLSRRSVKLIAETKISQDKKEGPMIGDILRQNQVPLVINQHFSIVRGMIPTQGGGGAISYPGVTAEQMKLTQPARHGMLRRLLRRIRQKVKTLNSK